MKLFVRVKTHAREEKVERRDSSNYDVSVKEPPTDGKANEAVCRALARYFDVARSCVSIVAGKTSKQKVVEIIWK